MDRCWHKSLAAFFVGSLATWPLMVVSLNGGRHLSISSMLSQAFSDPLLVLLAVAGPSVLAMATAVWSKRTTRLRSSHLALGEELARSREELSHIRRQLENAHAENEEVRNQLVRTTAKMRLRLSRLLSPKYSRERAFEPADVLDLERLSEIQGALASAVKLASSCRNVSGDPIGRIHNCTDFCRAIQDTPLGKQECFWFYRDLGAKAARRKSPVYKRCTASGLMCGAVPIMVDDRHVATWIVGQVRIHEFSDSDAAGVASRFGVLPNLLLGYQRAVPSLTLPEFETALRLAWHVSQEISDRSQAAWHLSKTVAQYRKAEEQLRLAWHALDHSDRGLVFAGHDWECLGATQAARDLLGYSDNEIRKLRFDDLMGPADLDAIVAGLRAESSSCDINIKDRRGQAIAVQVESFQVMVAGKPQRYIAFRPATASPASADATQSGEGDETSSVQLQDVNN